MKNEGLHPKPILYAKKIKRYILNCLQHTELKKWDYKIITDNNESKNFTLW